MNDESLIKAMKSAGMPVEELEKFQSKEISPRLTQENMFNLLNTFKQNLDKEKYVDRWEKRVKPLQEFSGKYIKKNASERDRVLQGYYDILKEIEHKRSRGDEKSQDLFFNLLKSYGELSSEAGRYPINLQTYYWKDIQQGKKENIPPLKNLKLHKTPRKK